MRKSLGLAVRPATFQGAAGARVVLEIEVYGSRLTEPVHMTVSEGTLVWRGGTPGSSNGTHYADLPVTVGQTQRTVTVTATSSGLTRTDTCVLSPTVVDPPPPPPTTNWGTPTRYVAPNGSTAYSGTDAAHPTTLAKADQNAVPGDVIYCAPDQGTFEWAGNYGPPRSGVEGKPIVWWSDGLAPFRFAGGTTSGGMVQVPAGVCYRAFDGLDMHGGGHVGFCINWKEHSHHIILRRARLHHAGAGGWGSFWADYWDVSDVDTWANGLDQGWSSGSDMCWGGKGSSPQEWALDAWPGFHAVINRVRNFGTADPSSNLSDGNGFIIDGPAPFPILLANSISFGNFGRGAQVLGSQSGPMQGLLFAVNVTLCMNSLQGADKPEAMNQYGRAVWANVLAVPRDANGYAWNLSNAYSDVRRHCLYEYGKLVGVSASPDLRQASGLLPGKPARPSSWTACPAPWDVPLTAFAPGAPAVGAGVDPATLTEANAAMQTQLRQYLAKDLAGKTRTAWDVGALAA
jgi:hypothetical protein